MPSPEPPEPASGPRIKLIFPEAAQDAAPEAPPQPAPPSAGLKADSFETPEVVPCVATIEVTPQLLAKVYTISGELLPIPFSVNLPASTLKQYEGDLEGLSKIIAGDILASLEKDLAAQLHAHIKAVTD